MSMQSLLLSSLIQCVIENILPLFIYSFLQEALYLQQGSDVETCVKNNLSDL